MTLEQILELPRKEEDTYTIMNRLGEKFNFSYDFGIDFYSIDFNNKEDFKDIKIYTLFEKMVDHRRGKWIEVLTYKGKDVMLFLMGGREGDDYKRYHMIDETLFVEVMSDLKGLEKIDIGNYNNQVGIIEMNTFYGIDLDKELFDINLDLPYSVGDIIEVDMKLNVNDTEETTVRGKIIEIDNKTTNKTYQVKLLDWVYSVSIKDRDIIYPKYSVFDFPNDWNKLSEEDKKHIQKIGKKERNFVMVIFSYEEGKKFKKI